MLLPAVLYRWRLTSFWNVSYVPKERLLGVSCRDSLLLHILPICRGQQFPFDPTPLEHKCQCWWPLYISSNAHGWSVSNSQGGQFEPAAISYCNWGYWIIHRRAVSSPKGAGTFITSRISIGYQYQVQRVWQTFIPKHVQDPWTIHIMFKEGGRFVFHQTSVDGQRGLLCLMISWNIKKKRLLSYHVQMAR